MIAFFAAQPGSSSQNAEQDEALSDFRLYVEQARKSLRASGVDLKVTYAPAFQIRLRGVTRIFRPARTKVGFYLVAPGKPPRVEYGVMTDQDLQSLAHEYFETRSKLQGAAR